MNLFVLFFTTAQAAQGPGMWLRLDGDSSTLSTSLQIVLLLTVLSFLPALLLSLTSFTRLVIVLHLLRQGLGTQNMPPNTVLIGLALFLTFFIMAPAGEQIHREAILPVLEGDMAVEEAIGRAFVPLREFMRKQTREKDLTLFLRAAKAPRPKSFEDIPASVLIPAFLLSELDTAFRIGFILFLPFMVIDLVVAVLLLSMGSFQMPPIIVSLPLKILLFVLVDGWNLAVGTLIQSFA